MRTTHAWLLLCLSLAFALTACSSRTGEEPMDPPDDPPTRPAVPEMACAPGHDVGLSFRDATADWGIAGTKGTQVAVSDIDGDGFPDILAFNGVNHAARTDFSEAPTDWRYRVLRNVDGAGFEDITQASNFGATYNNGEGRVAHYAVIADLDDDGAVDIFSGAFHSSTPDNDMGDRSSLLLSDGSGGFRLATQQDVIRGSELNSTRPNAAATMLDFDRDGLLDLYLGYQYVAGISSKPDRLLRNVGGGMFEDATAEFGVDRMGDVPDPMAARPTFGATACDVNLDGRTDILGSSYGRQFNQLLLADGSSFSDVGIESGFAGDMLTDPSDNEMYKCFCASSDSCEAEAPRINCASTGWNVGFDDHPFRLNGNTFSTICGDIDNDGDMDLYNAEIAHFWTGTSSDSSQLLLQGASEGGVPQFTRPGNEASGLAVPRVGASWNEGGIAADMGDFDNDGLQDILLATSDYADQFLWVYRQQADGTFAEQSAAAGIEHPCAHHVAHADLDLDGDLDLIVASGTSRDCGQSWPDGAMVRIYENQSGSMNNWTRITLFGAGAGAANTSAVGAIVRATAGGVTRTREIKAGEGHLGGMNELAVSIGLGDACMIDELEIRWPDAPGTVTTLTDVPANYPLIVSQGIDGAEASVRYLF